MAGRIGDAASNLKRRRTTNTMGAAEPRSDAMASPTNAEEPIEVPKKIAIAAITRHPLNPRGKVVAGVDSLVASIKSVGLIEPIVVTGRAVFLAARPNLSDQIPETAEWVLIAGERRLVASGLAGKTHIDAVSGDHFMSEGIDLQTMVAENIERENLTPLQEAHAFQDMLNDKMSQRSIAKAVSRHQTHVSRRLRLLKLPDEVQAAIESGDLPISEAMELANAEDGKASPELIDRTWAIRQANDDLSIGAALRRAQNEHAAAAAIKQAEQQAVEEEIPLVNLNTFSGEAWRYAAHDEEVIETARQAGTLVAVATKDGLQYYDTAAADTDAINQAELDRQTETRAHKTAKKARRGSAAQAAASVPKVTQLLDALVDHILRTTNQDALKLAANFDSYAGDTDSWLASKTDQAARRKAAWTIQIARQELDASFDYTRWTDRQVTYLQMLEQHGYEITDYDRTRLQDSGTALPADEPDETTEDDQ